MKKIVSIEGMTCSHCVAHVDKALNGVSGVTKVKVDLKKNRAEIKVEGTSDQAIQDAVAEAGYVVTEIKTA